MRRAHRRIQRGKHAYDDGRYHALAPNREGLIIVLQRVPEAKQGKNRAHFVCGEDQNEPARGLLHAGANRMHNTAAQVILNQVEIRVVASQRLNDLNTLIFEIVANDEHFMLDLGPTPLHAAVISIATDVATLHALAHGDLDALDAVLADRLEITAGPDDLVAAAAAMTCFLQGAMRCVSMQPLLDRLAALRKERA